jgi:hypothetical protein
MSWNKVEKAVRQAHAIAFDGCHKIYLAMDEEQVRSFKRYGYDEGDSQMYRASEFDQPVTEMLDKLDEWWAESCNLRFISAVATVPDGTDPNLGYTDLIPQGDDEPDDDEESE